MTTLKSVMSEKETKEEKETIKLLNELEYCQTQINLRKIRIQEIKRRLKELNNAKG